MEPLHRCAECGYPIERGGEGGRYGEVWLHRWCADVRSWDNRHGVLNDPPIFMPMPRLTLEMVPHDSRSHPSVTRVV